MTVTHTRPDRSGPGSFPFPSVPAGKTHLISSIQTHYYTTTTTSYSVKLHSSPKRRPSNPQPSPGTTTPKTPVTECPAIPGQIRDLPIVPSTATASSKGKKKSTETNAHTRTYRLRRVGGYLSTGKVLEW